VAREDASNACPQAKQDGASDELAAPQIGQKSGDDSTEISLFPIADTTA